MAKRGRGFKPQPGLLFAFCEKARGDSDNPYVMIIDEINRANISKVFGNALVLLEASHRGEEDAVPIPIARENEAGSQGEFFIPDNVYFIGCMNTADRSLAQIDYALRRRFAFVDIDPCLEAVEEELEADMESISSSNGDRRKLKELKELLERVMRLNEAIGGENGLGKDFCIGHSYFCRQKDGEWPDAKLVEKCEIQPLIDEYTFGGSYSSVKEEWNKETASKTPAENAGGDKDAE